MPLDRQTPICELIRASIIQASSLLLYSLQGLFTLPASNQHFESTLTCLHSFCSPDSCAFQCPCLHPGCSFLGAHVNDLIPHNKKHQDPHFRYRTQEWCSCADEFLMNLRIRIHSNRRYVETSLPNYHSPRSYSLDGGPRSGHQIIPSRTLSTAQPAELQRPSLHAWLPSSESPCWPYTEQCTMLQHTLIIKGRRFWKTIRTCHFLIFLGFLTVLGSLIPALWRSVVRHDIQGGFSLAQYILGVGVFVVGCMSAVHSRGCTCWQ